jgi:hypothetical protein
MPTKIVFRQHVGNRVFIPRIFLCPSHNDMFLCFSWREHNFLWAFPWRSTRHARHFGHNPRSHRMKHSYGRAEHKIFNSRNVAGRLPCLFGIPVCHCCYGTIQEVTVWNVVGRLPCLFGIPVCHCCFQVRSLPHDCTNIVAIIIRFLISKEEIQGFSTSWQRPAVQWLAWNAQ